MGKSPGNPVTSQTGRPGHGAGPQSRANTCGFAHRSLGSQASGMLLALGVSSGHQPQAAFFLWVSGQRGGGRGPVSILRAVGQSCITTSAPQVDT